MADSKPKKRLIAASSDEDEEAGLPLSKRVKAEARDMSGDNIPGASASPGADGGPNPANATANGTSSLSKESRSQNATAAAATGAARPETEMPSAQSTAATTNGTPKAVPIQMEPDESSEDEALVKKAPRESPSEATKTKSNGHNSKTARGGARKKPASQGKAHMSAEESENASDGGRAEDGSDFSEDEKPLSKRAAPKKKKSAPAKRKSAASKSKEPSEEPPKKKRQSKAQQVKKEPTPASSPVKKAKTEDDGSEADGEDDEENKFAFLTAGDEGTGEKWQTLEHNGVLFPPDYEPLPSDVKLHYDGKPVDLPPESEEVAGFFAAMLDTDHVEKDVFRENFFKDFRKVLEQHPPLDGTRITEFGKCNFRPMADWFDAERQRKKSISAADKKRMKAEKDAAEEKYKTCKLNGKVEKVGNFRVEPPALFRGRGAHPKTGKLKTRVQPEQITINIGKDAPVPEPPAGHSWGAVQHDNTVSWLALWKENINGAFKYVFLAAGSSLKGESDFKKFEKARKLKYHIDDIRREYETQLKDKTMAIRQRATAVYLIDRFALRAGNEKGEDEAETVGCCSLKCGNITLTPPCNVLFDFLGKDSIRFLQAYDVSEQVFKNLRIFKKEPKNDDDLVFDRLNTTGVNNYLRGHMEGLSAKVFRTYNASWTFQQELEKRTNPDDSVYDKILSYNRANRDVAVLCNHQRSVAKTHGNSMTKMQDKLKSLKYQRRKLRWALLGLEDVDKKTRKQYEDDDESDLDEEWVEEHEESLRELAKERARKRFERDQVKKEEDESKDGVKEEAEETKPKPKSTPAKSKKAKKEESADEEEDEDTKPKRKGRGRASKVKKEEEEEDEEDDAEDVKPAKGTRKPKYLTEEDLEKLLAAADAEFEKNREETRSQTVETNKAEDKLLKEIEKKDQQIAAHRSQITDRDEGKEVSLGTSKLNYIDPRLTFAWCKKYEVPIEKMFSKTLREKFAWAASAPADWQF